jgi:hypothetical protein
MDQVSTCQPLRILRSDASSGPRLGGSAPQGISPGALDGRAEYLLTVPWMGRELSVFTAFVYSPEEPDCIWRLGKRVFQENNPYVEALLHEPTSRSRMKAYFSQFRGHSLEVERTRRDFDRDTGGPWPHSKLGGTPVFFDAGEDLEELARGLINEGFAHAVQLSMPTDKDAVVEGAWPFGDWIFHVFVRHSPSRDQFRFMWG